MEMIQGYDNWKLDNGFDAETEHICDGCFCEIDELSAEECGYCEDCLCDADYDPETETETECDGCFYCLCVSEYEERKADGTLNI